MNARVVTPAAIAGVLLSLTAVPWLWYADPRPTLLALRLAFLPPVLIITLQAGLAWGPIPDGRPLWRTNLPPRHIGIILAAACLVTAGEALFVEPIVAATLPGYLPQSELEVVLRFPWNAFIQPIILIVGVYAFTVRLVRVPAAGIAAVVAVGQSLAVAQFHHAATPSQTAWIVTATGSASLCEAVVLRMYGLPGLILFAVVRACRFFFGLPQT